MESKYSDLAVMYEDAKNTVTERNKIIIEELSKDKDALIEKVRMLEKELIECEK